MGDFYEGERVTTTFWMDFSIADKFGNNAIKDTYNRAFNAWKTNYKYLTELVMVLNHKCWDWNDKDNAKMELYRTLFYKARDWALEHLKGAELRFFLDVTD